MSSILRWNAVFLFPVGTNFDGRMHDLMVMPAQSIKRRGTWYFDPATATRNERDVVHGREVERRMQPFGDVGILMQFPTGSSPIQNLPRSSEVLPTLFQDKWNEGRMPRAEDKLERSPTELCRLVRAYLPEKWGLVALGITTAIVDIVQDGFIGSQVIVLDGSPTRTRFVYNTLEDLFGSGVQRIRPSGARERGGPSTTVHTSGAERSSHHHVQPTEDVVEEEGAENDDATDVDVDEEEVGDEEDEDEEEDDESDGDSEEEISGSEEEDDGESLHSEDTPERDGEHVHDGEADNASEDVSYDPDKSSDVEDETLIPEHDSESGGEMLEHEDPKEIEGTEESVEQDVHVDLEEHFDMNEEIVALGEQGTGVVGVEATFGNIPSEEVQVDGLLCSESLEATATIPDDTVPPSSVLLTSENVASGIEATTLSFAWARSSERMVIGADGLYYDQEGVRYRRVGEEGNYTYEQVASILEGDLNVGSIPSPVADAMVMRALDYADPRTPSEIRALLSDRHVEGEAGEELETQSSEVIPETQEME